MILLGRHNHHEAIAFSTVSFTCIDSEHNTKCFLYQNAHEERALMTRCWVKAEQVWIQQSDLELPSELQKHPNITIFFHLALKSSAILEGLFIYTLSQVQNTNARIFSCFGLWGFPLKILNTKLSWVADQFVLWVHWNWGWTFQEMMLQQFLQWQEVHVGTNLEAV